MRKTIEEVSASLLAAFERMQTDAQAKAMDALLHDDEHTIRRRLASIYDEDPALAGHTNTPPP